MKKLKYLILFLLLANQAQSEVTEMVRIKAIGKSPRGQFVAFEEYGYESSNIKRPYSNIKIINMWKNQVMKQYSNYSEVDSTLEEIREKSFTRGQKIFKEFNIAI